MITQERCTNRATQIAKRKQRKCELYGQHKKELEQCHNIVTQNIDAQELDELRKDNANNNDNNNDEVEADDEVVNEEEVAAVEQPQQQNVENDDKPGVIPDDNTKATNE